MTEPSTVHTIAPHVKWLIKEYRDIIYPGRSVDDIEKLYFGNASYQINAPLALIEMSVQGAVDMLRRMAVAGVLRPMSDPINTLAGNEWQAMIDEGATAFEHATGEMISLTNGDDHG